MPGSDQSYRSARWYGELDGQAAQNSLRSDAFRRKDVVAGGGAGERSDNGEAVAFGERVDVACHFDKVVVFCKSPERKEMRARARCALGCGLCVT